MLKINRHVFASTNKIVINTKKAKYLPNIFIVVILSLIMMFFVSILGWLSVNTLFSYAFHITHLEYRPSYTIFIALFSPFINIVVLFIWVKLVEKRDFNTLGFLTKNKLRQFLQGGLLAVTLFSAIVLILYLTGNVVYKGVTQHFSLGWFLCLFVGFFIQSSAEEIFSRGWQMSVIGARYGMVFGLIFSSLFFSVLHIFNDGLTVMALINLTLYSLFIGIYVLKTENLLQACGFHVLWNYIQGVVYGLPISGSQLPFSVIQSELVGSDMATGGIFGVEASVVTSIFFLFGIGYLLFGVDRSNDLI